MKNPRTNLGPSEILRQRVRKIRLQRGLTQAQLAERAGLSVDAVNRIESGRRNPNLNTIERLADALGIGAADLLASGTIPRQKLQRSVQRIVNLVELKDNGTIAVVEAVVKALLENLRERSEPTAIRGTREVPYPYPTPDLSIELAVRTVAFRGERIDGFDGRDGAVFAVLLLLACEPGRHRKIDEIKDWLTSLGADLPHEISNSWVLRDRILEPFRHHPSYGGPDVSLNEIEKLVSVDKNGGLCLELAPQKVLIVGKAD